METMIFDRARLAPGFAAHGPAIIEEYGATTVVFPGLGARVDRSGNLLMTRASGTHR